MFQTDQVAQPRNRLTGAEEIPEFSPAVHRGGVEDDVVVSMSRIAMGGHEKGVAFLEKTLRQLVPDAVGFLRRHFAGLEGLPDLVGDHIVFRLPARKLPVLPLGKEKLRVGGPGIAAKGGDQLAAHCLAGVFGIVRSVFQALGNRAALVQVHGYDARYRHVSLRLLRYFRQATICARKLCLQSCRQLRHRSL